MGNTPSSAMQPEILGAKLIPAASQGGRSRRDDQSFAHLIGGHPDQEVQSPDIYVDACGDAAVCCSASRDTPISFISREEALMKARYYKERNPELAKQAYLYVLTFPSTKGFGKSLGGPDASNSCGCSFPKCGIPQPVVACWASSQPNPHTCEGAGENWKRIVSAEAMSTAVMSGTASRLHTDDLDELVIHNPVAQKLHIGDITTCTSGKDEFAQLGDNGFRAEIHAELAQLHLMNGEPFEALECYQSASALAPDQLAYSYRKGVVFQQMGNREKAILCFRNVLQVDAFYKPALFNLGVCLAEDAETRAEALRMFEMLLSVDPNNGNALELIADIHEQEGRVEEAYVAKQRVVAIDPSNFRAGRDLARLDLRDLVSRGLKHTVPMEGQQQQQQQQQKLWYSLVTPAANAATAAAVDVDVAAAATAIAAR
ncbi:hypothetical protein Emag_003048 [Eimeria magna]